MIKLLKATLHAVFARLKIWHHFKPMLMNLKPFSFLWLQNRKNNFTTCHYFPKHPPELPASINNRWRLPAGVLENNAGREKLFFLF